MRVGKQRPREGECQGHITHKGYRYAEVGAHAPNELLLCIAFGQCVRDINFSLISATVILGFFLVLTSEVGLLYWSFPLG